MVPSPRYRKNLDFAILALLALCISCSAKSPPSKTAPSTASTSIPNPSTTHIFQVKIVGLPNTSGKCLIAVYASPRGFRNPDVAIAKEAIQLLSKPTDASQPQGDELVWSFALPPDLEASSSNSPALENAMSDKSPEVNLAITAFHDSNGNGELDKNPIGIPTEKYGFSKNPTLGFGPPSFDQTSIPLSHLKSLQSPIEIKLR